MSPSPARPDRTIDDALATVVAAPRGGAVAVAPPPIEAPVEAPTQQPDQDDVATQLFEDRREDPAVVFGSMPTMVRTPNEPPPKLTPPSDDSPLPADPAFRYEDLGLIGRGMMGEVRRVRDRDLNRVVAMKIVRGSLTGNRRLLARFISEAQAAAQLSHPGIVPIHELGVLPDRRFFFTMKEVRGETLRDVIRKLHASDEASWCFEAVIDAVLKTVDALAYAHDRGVIHRDLKPDNVMVGAFGEVAVLDWGLAKVLEGGRSEAEEPVVTNRSIDAGLATQIGTVAGTPCYMPPEQASGFFSTLTPAADVYALGAILYEVLLGRPPYSANDAREALASVIRGTSSVPPGRVGHHPSLAAIVAKAMAPLAEDRHTNGAELQAALKNWKDEESRREHARTLASDGARLLREAGDEADRIERAERRLRDALVAVHHGGDPTAWYRAEEQLAQVHQAVGALEHEGVALLRAALAEVPGLPEARSALGSHFREAHVDATRRRDPIADRLFERLRAHDDGTHEPYVEGLGWMTLRTEAPGARVVAVELVSDGRRMRDGERREIGVTPLVGVSLRAGSYRMEITQAGCEAFGVPVRIDRLGYWDGLPPREDSPPPVLVPGPGDLSDQERLVTAGWFRAGADPKTGAGPDDVWVDGFVVTRDPVTIDAFAAFLGALCDQGRAVEAARYAGPLMSGPTPILRRDGSHFGPVRAELGRLPVTGVTFAAARAFATWKALADGLPWRLPTEIEWEKAARGVDGRAFPWGDRPIHAIAATIEHAARPEPVDRFPGDESPYGVRGCAGNVAEWCADPWHPEGLSVDADGRAEWVDTGGEADLRAVRGGSFRVPMEGGWVGRRGFARADVGDVAIGFRLARTVGSVR
jgi:serine/threonine protein kinase/formylglycine-generating enzyme required for sulfatase activity